MNASFYQAILPLSGFYCAVGITGDNIVDTSFHKTIEALEQRGQFLMAEGFNAFFALASYQENSVRKTDNTKELRSFFIDLDCGAGKPYPDQAAAHIALNEFIALLAMPTPYIVNSGRGLHVYWPFETAVDYDTWRPLAKAFKKLCIDSRLHIDMAVSADAARVLRMPDTLNFKVAPPLPTAVLQMGETVPLSVLQAKLPVIVDLSAARMFGQDEMTRKLAGGDYPATEFKRIVHRSLKGHGCAQITNAVLHAATLEEPLWRAALSIAWRCTDAETAIHTLSRAHPEYSADNTIRKAQETKGPMTCEWYKSNYADACAGCTHRVTSPISLGKKVEAAEVVNDAYLVEQQLDPDNVESGTPQTVQVEIPVYPHPYFRGAHGGVYLRTKDKDGDPIEKEVYKYDLYLTSRYYDADEQGGGEGEVIGVNLHTPHDGIRKFMAPVTHILTKEKMRDLLLKHGVVAINKELDDIMAYLASSIRNLQKMFAADRTRNQMGWTADNSGFVVGELEYTAHGVRLAPASSGTQLVAPMLQAKGDLAKWSEMVNFYNRPGMEAHALAVFFGFGAPLLRLLGGIEVRGAAINLMSNKSGTGKTTAQMVVNSIFGHPNNLLLKKSDTTASKVQFLGMLNSIAATMDEVTNLGDEELSEFIYDIPQGRGKHRMESQSNKMRSNVVSWMTFVITSSNSSLYDKLARLKSTSDGELRRLIELRIIRPVEVSKQESDAVFGTLVENYGLAGPVFIQYVIKHYDDIADRLRKMQQKIDADLDLTQSDRFYSSVMACAFVGALIARKLGLHNLEVPRIYKYALTTISEIRRDVIAPAANTEFAAQETLATYINENLSNTLVIPGNRAANGMYAAAIREPRGPLRVRYEPDTHELWIPATALRDYFVGRQVDVHEAIKELASRGILKNGGASSTKRIGAGATGSFESIGVRCYCVDGSAVGIDHTAFVGAENAKPMDS